MQIAAQSIPCPSPVDFLFLGWAQWNLNFVMYKVLFLPAQKSFASCVAALSELVDRITSIRETKFVCSV